METTAGDIRRLGRQAWTIAADVGKPAECEEACKSALDQHGPIDILINNVGGRRENIPTESMPLEKWRELIDLNLTSCFICTKMARARDDRAAAWAGASSISRRSMPLSLAAALRAGTMRRRRRRCFSLPLARRRLGRTQDHGQRHPARRVHDGAKPRWSKLHPEVIEGFRATSRSAISASRRISARSQCTWPATPRAA